VAKSRDDSPDSSLGSGKLLAEGGAYGGEKIEEFKRAPVTVMCDVRCVTCDV
jgi:hypothetical protein